MFAYELNRAVRMTCGMLVSSVLLAIIALATPQWLILTVFGRFVTIGIKICCDSKDPGYVHLCDGCLIAGIILGLLYAIGALIWVSRRSNTIIHNASNLPNILNVIVSLLVAALFLTVTIVWPVNAIPALQSGYSTVTLGYSYYMCIAATVFAAVAVVCSIIFGVQSHRRQFTVHQTQVINHHC